MAELLYTSLNILLIVVSVKVLTEATVICGPGTQPRKRSKGKVQCDICPPGTFSKGHHSKCSNCRSCERKPVLPCTHDRNAVCKEDGDQKMKECLSYWRNNQTDLFLALCGETRHYIQRFACSGSGCQNGMESKIHKDNRQDGKATPLASLEVPDSKNVLVNLEEVEKFHSLTVSDKGVHEKFRTLNIIISVIAGIIGSLTITFLIVWIKRKTKNARCLRMKVPPNCKHDRCGIHEAECMNDIELPYAKTRESITNHYRAHAMRSHDATQTRLESALQGHGEFAPFYRACSLSSMFQRDLHAGEVNATQALELPSAKRTDTTHTLVPGVTVVEPCNFYEPVGSTYHYEENPNTTTLVETIPLLTELDDGVDDDGVDDDGYSEAYSNWKSDESSPPRIKDRELMLYSSKRGLPEAEPIGRSENECHPHLLQLDSTTQQTPVTRVSEDSCFYDDCDVQREEDNNCSDDASGIYSDQIYAYPASDYSSQYISSQYDDTKPVTFKNIKNHHPVKDVNLQAAAAGEHTFVPYIQQEEVQTSSSEEASDIHYVTDPFVQEQDPQADISESSTMQNSTIDAASTYIDQISVQDFDVSARPKDLSKQECRPENLHENLSKTEGTQTRQNCENLLTIFGQKYDEKKYFTSEGGLLSKSTTDITLTVYPNSLLEGETVLVGGRFTCRSLDVLPFLTQGWVVISPLAEFEMTFRKRWDKHVKIYLPYYSHHPKEVMKVCYYHRSEDGEIQTGEVPMQDTTKQQDMYYIKKGNHVEIFTVTFTLFHCACDHKISLFMTSLLFMSYDKDENEAVVRLHVGDKLLGSKTFKEELKTKEGDENGTVLKKSTDIRILQGVELDGDSCLIFTIEPKSRPTSAEGTSWENLYPEQYPQTQRRRFQELIECKDTGNVATAGTNLTSGHSCHTEIEWRYKSTLAEPPVRFQCDLTITHELADGQETDRRGACKEGVTFIPSVKVSAFDEKIMGSGAPEYGIPELMSSRKDSFWNK